MKVTFIVSSLYIADNTGTSKSINIHKTAITRLSYIERCFPAGFPIHTRNRGTGIF